MKPLKGGKLNEAHKTHSSGYYTALFIYSQGIFVGGKIKFPFGKIKLP
ncbi:hypothetical protein Q6793_001461 [Campylobacter jejuni]|nr:hypothetical protein [Campylobacter jejuni]